MQRAPGRQKPNRQMAAPQTSQKTHACPCRLQTGSFRLQRQCAIQARLSSTPRVWTACMHPIIILILMRNRHLVDFPRGISQGIPNTGVGQFCFHITQQYAALSVAASSTSDYVYYSCKLAGQVIGSPVNSSSLEAATRSCNHQQHSACTVEYESSGDGGGCTAELKGTDCYHKSCMHY